jgi:hypothetical protein
MEHDTPLKEHCKQYNSSNNEYVIKEKVYFSDQYDKYSEDLQKGLSEGAGPDIIVTDPNRLPILSKYLYGWYKLS